jgi:hypothetical protein
MTARVTAVAVGVFLLILGVMATAGPGQPSRPEVGTPPPSSLPALERGVVLAIRGVGPTTGAFGPAVAVRPGTLAVTSAFSGLERISGKSGAWARLLLIGSGLLSLGLIVRRRLLGEEGEADTA